MLALHGDMQQDVRSETLRAFRSGASAQVLVGTDVAARGLDVKGIVHVINFDPPRSLDQYVHRVG